MSLSNELKRRGLTRSDLAELLDVSRQTITRMGDEISPKVQEALNDIQVAIDVPMSKKHKEPEDYTREEAEALFMRRGGIEGESVRVKETDYEIAHSVGLRVFEFNRLVKLYCADELK